MALVAVLCAALVLSALLLLGRRVPMLRSETIRDFECGLLYDKGVHTELLGAGRYRLWPSQTIVRVDMRSQVLSQGAQEVTTADGISVKVSLGGSYRVTDAALSVQAAANPLTLLYQEMQRAVRSAVAVVTLDDLLAGRSALDQAIFDRAATAAPTLGFELLTLSVRDLIFSGELKRALASSTLAQREGLAKLERARGETAALRNLANAARLLEEQPSLLQLRALQSVESSSSSTLVLGVDSKPVLPLAQKPKQE